MNSLSKEEKESFEAYANLATEQLIQNSGLKNLKDPLYKVNDINNLIILIRFPAKNDNLSGFSLKIDKYSCIYINSNHTLGRQYCSFWHEFYHIINDIRDELMINCENYDSKEEKEANQFAYCILLPRNKVRNYIISLRKQYDNMDLTDLIKMQYEFRVSLQILIYRLNEIYATKFFFKFKRMTLIENREEYELAVLNLGLDLDLISPTRDFCVPSKFFKDLHSNLSNNRINIDKVREIMNVIDERGVEGKW